MKNYASWFGVMMVSILAVYVTEQVWTGINFNHTMLTGQVLQSDAGIVTLNLGELAALQTPESAVATTLPASDLTQTVHLSVHAAPNGKAGDRTSQTFVSWQRDTVLDLSNARCFSLTETGHIEETSPEDIAPQDILNITIGSRDTPATVFVLSGVCQGEIQPETLQGTAANLIENNTHKADEEYESSATDENALRIAAADVSLHNVRINKNAGEGSDTEAGDRYGMNAALLATGGAQLTVTKSVVDSAATGGSGIFGHGFGTSLWLRDGTVTTTGDGSEGIQAAGGAAIQANNMTVITAGDSSSVLRVDNGTLEVKGGTYTSGGYQSPALLAAGSVHASKAAFTANNSAVVLLRGSQTVSLENCTLRGGASQEETAVMISGEDGASEGAASFSMTGGTLTAQSGSVLYALGTDCDIHLEHVDLDHPDNAPLLYVAGTEEGKGSAVTLYASRQTLEGSLVVDGYSALHLELQNDSLFHGAIVPFPYDEPSGHVAVYIRQGSVWSLTGDSTVDTLENEGTIRYNGYSITLGDGTVLTS